MMKNISKKSSNEIRRYTFSISDVEKTFLIYSLYSYWNTGQGLLISKIITISGFYITNQTIDANRLFWDESKLCSTKTTSIRRAN